MNANLELAEESVDLSSGVLWDLVLQRVQRSMDVLEVPMDIALDFGEAVRGISDGMRDSRNWRTAVS